MPVKRFQPWLHPAVVVPLLYLLYMLVVAIMPSPFAAILLGLGVVLAARTWEVRGGLFAALASLPVLAFGYRQLIAEFVLKALPEHLAAVTPWMMRLYGLLWMALLALGLFVGSMTRQTRALNKANADLRHAQQRLTALHQIATSLSTTLDVGKLLDTILEQLGHLWGYDHGAILLLDEATGELEVAGARGYATPAGRRLPATAGICGAVIQSGQAMYVADVDRDGRYIPGVRGARSEIAVPLVWEGRILGVLNVESELPGAYNQADLDLLATVAEQAAVSIGNARLHEQTRHLAITDENTGLYNYRHFQDRVAEAVRSAQLTGSPCSLLMLDLDHFKRVNDTYGHLTGDSVLQQMARVLREACRAEDEVFRYGGEEFAILLPDTLGEAAGRVAERIRERVANHPFSTRSGRRLDFALTVSLGVATYPSDALSQMDLILAVDKALYGAKAAGRNRVMTAAQMVHAEPA
jgi:diguanylate cyclase (GGDEF)-like protein